MLFENIAFHAYSSERTLLKRGGGGGPLSPIVKFPNISENSSFNIEKIYFYVGIFLPVGTPPARRGFNARCCRPRWKGYLRLGPGLLWRDHSGEVLNKGEKYIYGWDKGYWGISLWRDPSGEVFN